MTGHTQAARDVPLAASVTESVGPIMIEELGELRKLCVHSTRLLEFPGRPLRFRPVTSSRSATIQRRIRTIPAMLGATAVAVFGLPILAPAAVAWDAIRLQRRLPTLRLYMFVVQYLVNDTIEILAAPFLWIAAGFGTRLTSSTSLKQHEQLQTWSVETLARRAKSLLRLDVSIDHASLAAAAPGPIIVLSRHVSIFDSSLPGILCARAGLRPSGVIMAELLADPGFDLIYGRLGSVFIPRDDGPAALEAIRAMTAGADERSAFIIYPEGRLFGPSRLERAMERMQTDDPARATRLADLTRLLPPRPGGVLALLAALPEADVVLVDHAGLDTMPRLKHLAARIPADTQITVSATRIRRDDIPVDPAEQVIWLDELWLGLEKTTAAQARMPTPESLA